MGREPSASDTRAVEQHRQTLAVSVEYDVPVLDDAATLDRCTRRQIQLVVLPTNSIE